MARVERPGKDTAVPSVRDFSSQLTRSLLKTVYETAARDGQIPSPDQAMERMHKLIEQLWGGVKDEPEPSADSARLARFDLVGWKREAHHYAVDLYYKAIRPSKGAPPLREDYLQQLLKWHGQGLSPRKLAIKLGYGPSLEAKERVTKQLRTAKTRSGKK